MPSCSSLYALTPLCPSMPLTPPSHRLPSPLSSAYPCSYRSAALLYHPDRYVDRASEQASASEKFVLVAEGQKEKRRRSDARRGEAGGMEGQTEAASSKPRRINKTTEKQNQTQILIITPFLLLPCLLSCPRPAACNCPRANFHLPFVFRAFFAILDFTPIPDGIRHLSPRDQHMRSSPT